MAKHYFCKENVFVCLKGAEDMYFYARPVNRFYHIFTHFLRRISVKTFKTLHKYVYAAGNCRFLIAASSVSCDVACVFEC